MGIIARNKLVFGVGVNDAEHEVYPTINGKKVMCPFYSKWNSMVRRCYSDVCQASDPTYIGCSVVPEWLTFSCFKMWMENQDWQGKHLDKDLLIVGNKIYSPDTCVFISQLTNSFTVDCAAVRGEWPIGVHWDIAAGKFKARCSNPFTKKSESLGYFTCQHQAHQAWKNRKHQLACQLADMQSDPRVAAALRVRYK